jgi:hypothetical protein
MAQIKGGEQLNVWGAGGQISGAPKAIIMEMRLVNESVVRIASSSAGGKISQHPKLFAFSTYF